jgi:hypothetical protein
MSFGGTAPAVCGGASLMRAMGFGVHQSRYRAPSGTANPRVLADGRGSETEVM